MPVSILARHRTHGVSIPGIRRQACRLLRLLGETPAELSIALVSAPEIQCLNATFRGRNAATDVLAFAMREGERTAGDQAMLGDVVISLDTALRQARRRGVPVGDEVTTLLVHGVLHLLGYDHERSAAEARRMRRKERELKAGLHAAASGARSRRGSSRRSGL